PQYSGVATVNDQIAKAVKELASGDSADDKTKVILNNLLGASLPGPPPVITDPWVVLATLHFNGDVITAIDPVTTRRLVVSVAPLWWSRLASALTIDANGVAVDAPKRTVSNDRATVNLTVTGTGLMSIQKDTKKDNIKFQSNSDKFTIESVTPDGTSPDKKLT